MLSALRTVSGCCPLEHAVTAVQPMKKLMYRDADHTLVKQQHQDSNTDPVDLLGPLNHHDTQPSGGRSCYRGLAGRQRRGMRSAGAKPQGVTGLRTEGESASWGKRGRSRARVQARVPRSFDLSRAAKKLGFNRNLPFLKSWPLIL